MDEQGEYYLSPERQLTAAEKRLVWTKPLSHKVSDEERRIIAVITTNRSYAGSRPLNQALRDRVQHSEKMDLPTEEIMIERAIAKVGYKDETVLSVLAE